MLWHVRERVSAPRRMGHRTRAPRFSACTRAFARLRCAICLGCWQAAASPKHRILGAGAVRMRPPLRRHLFRVAVRGRDQEPLVGGQVPRASPMRRSQRAPARCGRVHSRLVGARREDEDARQMDRYHRRRWRQIPRVPCAASRWQRARHRAVPGDLRHQRVRAGGGGLLRRGGLCRNGARPVLAPPAWCRSGLLRNRSAEGVRALSPIRCRQRRCRKRRRTPS